MTHDEYVEAFRAGANAMQGRIVAWLVTYGHIGIAPSVLALTLPQARPPECATLDAAEHQRPEAPHA